MGRVRESKPGVHLGEKHHREREQPRHTAMQQEDAGKCMRDSEESIPIRHLCCLGVCPLLWTLQPQMMATCMKGSGCPGTSVCCAHPRALLASIEGGGCIAGSDGLDFNLSLPFSTWGPWADCPL